MAFTGGKTVIPSTAKAGSPNVKMPGIKTPKGAKTVTPKAPKVSGGGMKAYLAASKANLFS